METTSNLPGWFVPVLLVGFPLLFAGFWSLICALLATLSGYRSLMAFRIDEQEAKDGDPVPTPWFAMIGAVSYRGGILSLRTGNRGLTLRVLRLFPFHPAIRIPWERIEVSSPGGGLFGRLAGPALLLDGRVRLRAPADTIAVIVAAKANPG